MPTIERQPHRRLAERTDIDMDFIQIQLRETFEARLDQMLALPYHHPATRSHVLALEAINAALSRIHDGTYGTCANCGVDISAARLEVVPTTTRCVRCPQRHVEPA